jgi:hypothetical protein
MGPPLTLRNYILQYARQHTVIYTIGRLPINFSKKTLFINKYRNFEIRNVLLATAIDPEPLRTHLSSRNTTYWWQCRCILLPTNR